MMKPVLDIKLFRKDSSGKVPEYERIRSQKAMLWMMEGLCRVNQDQLTLQRKLGKPVPLLYGSGIVYQREDGTEDWQDVYTTIEKGWGDCEDLACFRVAELREVFGRKASPFVTYRRGPEGEFHYHALVVCRSPDGTWRLEDPSRKMGMGFEDLYDGLGPKARDKLVGMFDRIQKRTTPRKLLRLKEVIVFLNNLPSP